MFPIKCFATSETHNTPRTASRKGGIELSKIAYLLNKIMPLPTFIHSGFELCEIMPINTGLGFESIDTTKLTTDVLPLFSTSKLNWTGENILDFIVKANNILEPYIKQDYTLKIIKTKDDSAVAFETIGNDKLFFIASYDYPTDITIDLQTQKYKILLGDASIKSENNKLTINLKEFSFLLLEL